MHLRGMNLVLLALGGLALGGCGENKAIQVVVDSGPGPKSDGAPEVKDGPVTTPDGAVPDSTVPQGAALEAVVNSLTLPTDNTKFPRDLDGNGIDDNQLGAIISTLSIIPGGSFDFQGSIDEMFTDGSFLMLMDVAAESLVDAAAAALNAYLGLDQDFPADPTDDFSGDEELLVDPETPPGLTLTGAIAAAHLEVGPGTLVIPIPLGDNPVNVTITSAYATADVSAAGMQNGQINGAIPWTEVDTKLIPNITDMLNEMYQEMEEGFLKDLLKGQLDYQEGSEGVITADEVRNSPLIGMVLKADVDTDGDNVEDAMSLGVGFTAVPCKIKH